MTKEIVQGAFEAIIRESALSRNAHRCAFGSIRSVRDVQPARGAESCTRGGRSNTSRKGPASAPPKAPAESGVRTSCAGAKSWPMAWIPSLIRWRSSASRAPGSRRRDHPGAWDRHWRVCCGGSGHPQASGKFVDIGRPRNRYDRPRRAQRRKTFWVLGNEPGPPPILTIWRLPGPCATSSTNRNSGRRSRSAGPCGLRPAIRCRAR